ncbi:N-acetyltransferase [Proteobacteria bacterium 005FR1]|nr:N-acetyltransferase [Proteobacteria bacterium 005FR1]
MSTQDKFKLRPVKAADAEAMVAIYNHFIETTVITFEEQVITTGEMQRRIADVQKAGLPWLVVEDDSALAGYAYAAPWRTRSAYRFSVETTIYLHPAFANRGIGTLIYNQLLTDLKACGMHLAIGGITLPNPASVSLHERCGFEKVAHFKEVGYKLGEWLDVGYWQRKL